MSTNVFTPTKGTVILAENLLPLYPHLRRVKDDAAYDDYTNLPEGALAYCDEENFFKISIHDIFYAVSNYYAHTFAKAIDELGGEIPITNAYHNCIVATNSVGKPQYFTNAKAALANNYKFSFRYNIYCHADDKERLYGNQTQFSYHTSQSLNSEQRAHLPKFHDEDDEFLVGLEVEKTDSSLRDDGLAWEIAEKSGWVRERDGSLGTGGYELVSPILPLFDAARIEQSIAPVAKYINGNADSSCGGHINISRKSVTESRDLLESFKHFAPVLYALYPHRLDNNYCRAKQWSSYFRDCEKYQAFNFKMHGIVEIRLFGKIKNVDTLRWRLQLLRLLLPVSGTQKNLNQIAQQIGCIESKLYKHLAAQYSHAQIGAKLVEIDKYAKRYGTHKNGLSDSVKNRINVTMGYDVFTINVAPLVAIDTENAD
jgi:hypothetical protein